jgi:hypothetical protein
MIWKDLLVYIEFEQVQSVSFVRYTCPVPSANSPSSSLVFNFAREYVGREFLEI